MTTSEKHFNERNAAINFVCEKIEQESLKAANGSEPQKVQTERREVILSFLNRVFKIKKGYDRPLLQAFLETSKRGPEERIEELRKEIILEVKNLLLHSLFSHWKIRQKIEDIVQNGLRDALTIFNAERDVVLYFPAILEDLIEGVLYRIKKAVYEEEMKRQDSSPVDHITE